MLRSPALAVCRRIPAHPAQIKLSMLSWAHHVPGVAAAKSQRTQQIVPVANKNLEAFRLEAQELLCQFE